MGVTGPRRRWDDLRQTVNGFMGSLRVAVVLWQGKRKRKDAQLATDTQMWRGEVGRGTAKRKLPTLALTLPQKVSQSFESNFTFLWKTKRIKSQGSLFSQCFYPLVFFFLFGLANGSELCCFMRRKGSRHNFHPRNCRSSSCGNPGVSWGETDMPTAKWYCPKSRRYKDTVSHIRIAWPV